MIPPPADEPCEDDLRNSRLDWDAILAGGALPAETLREQASLIHLRNVCEEYDAVALEVNGPVPMDGSADLSGAVEIETIRPEPLLQAS
jgi:hypothetical protein